MTLNFNELVRLEVETSDPQNLLANNLAPEGFDSTLLSVTNPLFTTNTTNWAAGTGWTLTRITSPVTQGQLTRSSSVTAGSLIVSYNQNIPASAGNIYHAYLTVKRVSTSPASAEMQIRFNVVAYNASNVRLGTIAGYDGTKNTEYFPLPHDELNEDNYMFTNWTQPAPAGTSYVRIEVLSNNAWTYAATAFNLTVTDLQVYLEMGRTVPGWTVTNAVIDSGWGGWSVQRTGEGAVSIESDKATITPSKPTAIALDFKDGFWNDAAVSPPEWQGINDDDPLDNVQVGIRYYTSGNVFISESLGSAVPGGDVVVINNGTVTYEIANAIRPTLTGVAPSNAAKASVVIKPAGTTYRQGFNFDKVVLIQGDTSDDVAITGHAESMPKSANNKVMNPSGELGVQGWTDWGSLSVLTTRDNLPANAAAYGLRLGGSWNEEAPADSEIINIQTADGFMALFSNTTPVSPGQWVGGGALCKGRGYHVPPYSYVIESWVAVGWQFRNSADAVISTVMSDYILTQNDYYRYITAPPTVAPAGTVRARMVIQNSGTSGSFVVQKNGGWLMAKQAQMNVGATEASVTNQPLDSAEKWKNILGPTHEIGIDRSEMDTGVLSAEILDPNLDPAEFDTLVPGLKVRLRTLVDDAWQTTFYGSITNLSTNYDVDPATGVLKPRIQLQAADPIAILANTPSASTVATINGLANNMPSSVRWNINGQTAVGTNPTIVGVNQSATVLDQVAITRDTEGGYAWMDRTGVFNAWSPGAFDLYKNKVWFRDDARPAKTGSNANLIPNPAFTTNTTTWSQSGASSFTSVIGYGKVIALGSQACYIYPTTLIGCTAGDTISVAIDATSSSYYRGQIAFYDQAGVETGSRVNTSIVTGLQTSLTATGTVPTNAISCRLFIVLYSNAAGANPSVGNTVEVNRVVMVANPTADWAYEYITGDDDFAYWTGAANASVSVKDYGLYQDYLTNIDIGYNTKEVINQVTVKQNKKNESGAYEELAFGPYEDTASVDTWGASAIDINVADGVDVEDVAIRILEQNAIPELTVNSVTFLVDDIASFNKAATIDLYDQVALHLASKFDGDLRVAGITHSLTAGIKNGLADHRWEVTLHFKALTTAAQMTGAAPKPTTNVNPGAVYQMSRINTDQAYATSASWQAVTAWTGIEQANTTYSAGAWTVSKAGRYAIAITVSWGNGVSTNATVGHRGVRPIINGSSAVNVLTTPIPTFQTTLNNYGEYRLAAGATVAFQVYQNSGSSQNLRGDSAGLYTTCSLRWVGE